LQILLHRVTNGQNENPFRDLCIIFFSEIMPEAFYLDRRVISVADVRYFTSLTNGQNGTH
jgi:hypothetical protein